MEDHSTVKYLTTPNNTAAPVVITLDTPRIDTRALDITPHHLPITSEPAPGNVFHPGLRGQIRGARARRERLHNTEKPELFKIGRASCRKEGKARWRAKHTKKKTWSGRT